MLFCYLLNNYIINKKLQMVIHCHHSSSPVSGEMKRIINIDTDVAGYLSEEVVELEFYSIRNRQYVKKEGQFTLSNKVRKKHYVANIPRLGWLNDCFRTIIILSLFIRYKPQYYIEEWTLSRGIKLVKRLFGNCNFGLDIHGASPEEYEYLNGKESHLLSNQERYSVFAADYIICQSDEMKRHLERKYSDSLAIGVYRCGVDCSVFKMDDNDRRVIRAELGYKDDDVVFVYSGGMHAWQKVEDSVRFFSKYHQVNDKAKLLVLTKDQEGFNNILDKIGENSLKEYITIKSLGYKDVPKYLNASDVAFLLRDNHVMNAVASPTKLSEYMACGLPVISTRVSEKWLDEEGMKYIYDVERNDVNHLTSFMKDCKRDEIAEYAVRELSLERDREMIHSFIEKL